MFVIPAQPDKFVWSEFGQPKVGPQGKVHGRTLQSSDFVAQSCASAHGFRHPCLFPLASKASGLLLFRQK
jgi:hypothetical protein